MTQLLTTADIARELAVSEEYVREHAAELGAIRLGNPRNGPLRFRRVQVDSALEARRIQSLMEKRRRRPGPPRRPSGDVELLPLPRGAG